MELVSFVYHALSSGPPQHLRDSTNSGEIDRGIV